jgi:hypothetical protein
MIPAPCKDRGAPASESRTLVVSGRTLRSGMEPGHSSTWSPTRRSLRPFAVVTLSALALVSGHDAPDASAASSSPAPGATETPIDMVYLEVWPVIRAPDITEGRGDSGWSYTALFDGADVMDSSLRTGLEEPAYWTLRLAVGTTARVALTQVPRDGFSLQKVTCTETFGDSLVDREVAVTLEGSTASFEVSGVDPTYVCSFFNLRLTPPRTDSAAAGSPSSDGFALASPVILTASFAAALALAMRRFRLRLK